MGNSYSIFDKYVVPILISFIFMTGIYWLVAGEHIQGLMNILTSVYLVFQFIAHRTLYIPTWALVIMVILTLLMTASCGYLLYTGQYFGLFAYALVTAAGVMTMYKYRKEGKR
ncbi:putative membrane protein [Bacillus phage BCP8-2]|uniref:Putative membrane protein n=1 Tax=Bacillus phage BCP8-2 TaxID=1129192 RepID=A0A0E3D9J9_9CAUD|nr:hypothetical protein BCP8-2_147 [Bacillus phage BCP8-2]AHJ87185.1 putative membrane protein [Bacillus phage BCP8-2]